MEISLSKPYKLCDYKPAYGFLFSEYLIGYKHWGHCDIDTILGDLDHYLTDEILDNYDKIFCLGHLILYKNTPDINNVFMTDSHYKRIFTTDKNCIFDESSCHKNITIDQLFEKKQLRIYKESYAMDVYVYSTMFRQLKYILHKDKYQYELEKRKKPCIYGKKVKSFDST